MVEDRSLRNISIALSLGYNRALRIVKGLCHYPKGEMACLPERGKGRGHTKPGNAYCGGFVAKPVSAIT